jgi:hypothetical protein
MPIFSLFLIQFKANIIDTTFMEIVQKLHGVPKIIVSDRGPIFTGNFWTELFSCLGTQLDHKSSYHPQSNGKIHHITLEREYKGSSSGGPHRAPTRGSQTIEGQLIIGTEYDETTSRSTS